MSFVVDLLEQPSKRLDLITIPPAGNARDVDALNTVDRTKAKGADRMGCKRRLIDIASIKQADVDLLQDKLISG